MSGVVILQSFTASHEVTENYLIYARITASHEELNEVTSVGVIPELHQVSEDKLHDGRHTALSHVRDTSLQQRIRFSSYRTRSELVLANLFTAFYLSNICPLLG